MHQVDHFSPKLNQLSSPMVDVAATWWRFWVEALHQGTREDLTGTIFYVKIPGGVIWVGLVEVLLPPCHLSFELFSSPPCFIKSPINTINEIFYEGNWLCRAMLLGVFDVVLMLPVILWVASSSWASGVLDRRQQRYSPWVSLVVKAPIKKWS